MLIISLSAILGVLSDSALIPFLAGTFTRYRLETNGLSLI